jgi:hypothetical protein
VLRVLHALDGDGPDEGLEDGQEVLEEGRVLRHWGEKRMRRRGGEREEKVVRKGRWNGWIQLDKRVNPPSFPPFSIKNPTCGGQGRLNDSVPELRQHGHLVLGRHPRCHR